MPSGIIPIENLNITADAGTGHKVMLSWDIPYTSDYEGVLIRYAIDTYPASETDGNFLVKVKHTDDPNNFYIHAGLPNDVVYYYALFSYDKEGNYAAAITGSGQAQDYTPPPPITDFKAEPEGYWKVKLSWNVPVDSDYEGVLIRYWFHEYPQYPMDYNSLDLTPTTGGRIAVTDSLNHEFIHWCSDYSDCQGGGGTGHATAPGTMMYYAAFAYDDVDNFSEPVFASLAPRHKPVEDLTGMAGNGRVYLQYRLPPYGSNSDSRRDQNMYYTKIVHKLDTAPTDITDGELVRSEPVYDQGGSCNNQWYFITLPDVTNDETHCYSLFTCSYMEMGYSTPESICLTPSSTIEIVIPDGGSTGDVEGFENRAVGTYPSNVCGGADWCAYDAETGGGCGEDRWAVINDPAKCGTGDRCLWSGKYDDTSGTVNPTPNYITPNRTEAYFERDIDLTGYTHAILSYRMRNNFASYHYFYLRINDEKVRDLIEDSSNYYNFQCGNGNCSCDSDIQSNTDIWFDYSLDLSSWAGSAFTLQFHYEHNRTSSGCGYSEDEGSFLDDIVIEGWCEDTDGTIIACS